MPHKKCDNCCCDEVIGVTSLSPPVDAPVGNDPVLLYNQTTGEIWGWDGDSWELRNPVPAYKVYTALLTQSGTDAPVVDSIVENTLGDIVWTYDSLGFYIGTLIGAFTEDKTILSPMHGIASSMIFGGHSEWGSANTILVLSDDGDDILNKTVLEIHVYN